MIYIGRIKTTFEISHGTILTLDSFEDTLNIGDEIKIILNDGSSVNTDVNGIALKSGINDILVGDPLVEILPDSEVWKL